MTKWDCDNRNVVSFCALVNKQSYTEELPVLNNDFIVITFVCLKNNKDLVIIYKLQNRKLLTTFYIHDMICCCIKSLFPALC